MVVVLGHGSRASEHNSGFEQLVDMVRSMTDLPVESAYMENNAPDLGTVLRQASAQGFQRFILMPLFLFKGIHVAKDVPLEIANIKAELPEIEVVFAQHLGADPRIAEIVLERIKEVI